MHNPDIDSTYDKVDAAFSDVREKISASVAIPDFLLSKGDLED